MQIKLKTRKSAFKRIKKSKNHFVHKKANFSHLLRNKSKGHGQNVKAGIQLHSTDRLAFRKMLPYL